MIKHLPLALCALSLCAACSQHSLPEGVVGQTHVHKYGLTVSPDDWAKRGESGTIISTLENGVTVSNTYELGVLEGASTFTFPHSDSIEKELTYEKGQLNKEKTFFANGVPKQEVVHNGSRGRTITTWYEDGTPASVETLNGNIIEEGRYFNTKNECESKVIAGNGVRFRRDASGNLLSEDKIEDGELCLRTTYHPNGVPKRISPYEQGNIHGHVMSYSSSGVPQTDEEWRQGKQHGTTIVFQNGEKYAEVPYIAGRKQGVEMRFRSGEVLAEEISWAEDTMHGPKTIHFGQEPQKTQYFHKGKPVSRVEFNKLNPRRANA